VGSTPPNLDFERYYSRSFFDRKDTNSEVFTRALQRLRTGVDCFLLAKILTCSLSKHIADLLRRVLLGA
jgi:hypothetical protein